MAFAQKLLFKRPYDAGKTAATFLNEVTAERFILAGMMCDAATETMNFIRKVDTENLDNADICSFIEHFLKHIWFLFYERGVLSVASHTSFIIEWLESRAVHFVVRGVGKSIGGVKVKLGAINRALEHMKAWVHLARACIEAEFPSFSLINAFSAFKLPRERSKNTKTCNEIVEAKLKRLAIAFSKPRLKDQFRALWNHAFVAYRDANFNVSTWVAWRIGIEKVSHRPHGDLLHVILRGQTWSTATSKIEQSFSVIDSFMPEVRLNASAAVEDRYINLKLMHYEKDGLKQLMIDAQKIWRQCFPRRHSRTSLIPRSDVYTPHKYPKPNEQKGVTEKQFLKRLVADIANKATSGRAPKIEQEDKPTIWNEGHDQELDFQVQKRRKREVEAHMNGQLVGEEQTLALDVEAHEESLRQTESYNKRVNARVKYMEKVAASPPEASELINRQFYLDQDLERKLPAGWYAKLASMNGLVVGEPWRAEIFVSSDPRAPTNTLMTLAACLRGAWIIAPDVLLGKQGPSIKYKSSLVTRRQVFATPSFRSTHAVAWRMILEFVQSAPNRWNMLPDVRKWANARALAESKKRPAEVLAIVAPAEAPGMKHCFVLEEFTEFITSVDLSKGSIGSLNM